jgi:hypothetical protein
MGVLKFLLFAILFYYLFKLIFRIALPYILKYFIKKTEGSFNEFHTHDDKEEGEVTINRNPNKNKKDNAEGEYVDYEELD